ncbi:Uncharacterized protein DBV15_03069 [Temnothorax longispinosus]|uniref:Uncharacterized protein n=1 Tax=Temnothorax longispinosus TaxID=300112 RepID=A0A4S2KJ12_9HYME|nr:Uncharacterized protein DBV15_03069 [Temnothorax longispinosus]
MAHQAGGLPQLRIKFCNTIAAGLQIVLLLTVLPQVDCQSSQNSTMAFSRDHIAAPIRYELTSRGRYIISKVHVNSPAESCDCGPESKRLIAHEDPRNDL